MLHAISARPYALTPIASLGGASELRQRTGHPRPFALRCVSHLPPCSANLSSSSLRSPVVATLGPATQICRAKLPSQLVWRSPTSIGGGMPLRSVRSGVQSTALRLTSRIPGGLRCALWGAPPPQSAALRSAARPVRATQSVIAQVSRSDTLLGAAHSMRIAAP